MAKLKKKRGNQGLIPNSQHGRKASSAGQNAYELLTMALGFHQTGNLGDAEALYRQALTVSPDHPDANHLIGVLFHHTGRVEDAISFIKKALAIKPNEPSFLNNLGEAFRTSGNIPEAIKNYAAALAIRPDFAEVYNNLGLAHLQTGKLDEALSCFAAAQKISPDFPDPFLNSGRALMQQGKYQEAVPKLQTAIRHRPTFAQAYCSLGLAHYEQGHLDDAEVAYQKAIALIPDYAEAHNNLGNLLFDQGKVEEAFHSFNAAIRSQPDLIEAYINLADSLNFMGRLNDSEAVLRKALLVREDYCGTYVSLGNILQSQKKSNEASHFFAKALEIEANNPDALSGQGLTLRDQGRIAEAIVTMQRALQSRLDQATLDKYLYMLNFHPGLEAKFIADEHRIWNERLTTKDLAGAVKLTATKKNRHERLKVGYVSADFKNHSVAYFFEPLLRCHDSTRVEVFCYSNVKTPDSVTERIKKSSEHWCDIVWLSDQDAARQIYQDGIDILVDLAGHTRGNRLPIFAYEPAPIQITWLGYPNTTGMKSIQYRFTDSISDPSVVADMLYSEQLVRLDNGFLCYQGDNSIDPGILPFLENKHITFGSFNNLLKITPEVIELWAQILRKVSGSTIMMKARELEDEAARSRYVKMFADNGITPDRVNLLTSIPQVSEHLRLYNKIDIALDPIFYNGTTTTFEALWMGVPVVTLMGDRHASRVGASILSGIGRSDLVASDAPGYVEIASTLAHDIDRLQLLRNRLRHDLTNSPLCDAVRFAEKIEQSYFDLWQKWQLEGGMECFS